MIERVISKDAGYPRWFVKNREEAAGSRSACATEGTMTFTSGGKHPYGWRILTLALGRFRASLLLVHRAGTIEVSLVAGRR